MRIRRWPYQRLRAHGGGGGSSTDAISRLSKTESPEKEHFRRSLVALLVPAA